MNIDNLLMSINCKIGGAEKKYPCRYFHREQSTLTVVKLYIHYPKYVTYNVTRLVTIFE